MDDTIYTIFKFKGGTSFGEEETINNSHTSNYCVLCEMSLHDYKENKRYIDARSSVVWQ
jgi:hypothetical protein